VDFGAVRAYSHEKGACCWSAVKVKTKEARLQVL